MKDRVSANRLPSCIKQTHPISFICPVTRRSITLYGIYGFGDFVKNVVETI